MPMCHSDALLFYDGRIPPGEIDNSLPPRFSTSNPVRIVRVQEKPAATFARMARFIGTCLVRGELTRGDLLNQFTEAEIAAYAQDALRWALVQNPTLPTLEFAA